jgi:NAD(P)H dehydrogenase (quinone)
MATVLIVYASDYGGTKKMAEATAEGVGSVEGCEAVLKEAEQASTDDLLSADALILGTPVHMGSPDWRVKKFIDTSCSGPWMKNEAVGKIGAAFACGSGYGNGGAGCELAMLALLNNIAELGMLIVPLPKNTPGYQVAGHQWGPYARAHADNLEPIGVSDEKVEAARNHGANVARVAVALAGKTVFAS